MSFSNLPPSSGRGSHADGASGRSMPPFPGSSSFTANNPSKGIHPNLTLKRSVQSFDEREEPPRDGPSGDVNDAVSLCVIDFATEMAFLPSQPHCPRSSCQESHTRDDASEKVDAARSPRVVLSVSGAHPQARGDTPQTLTRSKRECPQSFRIDK
ncbi:hypothetical protein CISG_09587 [Coccidioides immitis RMSCC 3703]|uniref:Uncharacterized protein n=1 Tax=Coccidioides immitis RMSCC 3703 TaxID=454286 RepID=A0A0J8RBF1_COCIT|nr:hypothetical protein CISG_09587 [Coccidioides immitis RMSCC 3703]